MTRRRMKRARWNRKGLASAGPFLSSFDKQIMEFEMAERERRERALMTEVMKAELQPLMDAVNLALENLAAIQAGGGRRIKVAEPACHTFESTDLQPFMDAIKGHVDELMAIQAAEFFTPRTTPTNTPTEGDERDAT